MNVFVSNLLFPVRVRSVTVASVSHPLLRRGAASHAGETRKLSQIQPTVSWRNNLLSLKNVKESKQQQQQKTLFV